MDEVDRLIAEVNMQETFRRREVRGKDLNAWHPAIELWLKYGHVHRVVTLLNAIFVACESLEQYDPREPDPYWYQLCAGLHHKQGRHIQEEETLRRWMAKWPPERRPHKLYDIIRRKAEAAHRHIESPPILPAPPQGSPRPTTSE